MHVLPQYTINQDAYVTVSPVIFRVTNNVLLFLQ